MNNIVDVYSKKFKRKYAHIEKYSKDFTSLQFLSYFTIFLAVIALIYMFVVSGIAYFFTALVVGFFLLFMDFFIERKGILNNEWKYKKHPLKIKNVPIELLIFSFGSGVILTFIFNCFVESWWSGFVENEILGLNISQFALIFIGTFFFIRHFGQKKGTMVFWAFPFGIALFFEYPEPWILAVALIIVYLDYFIEKNLVKNGYIEYDKYSENTGLVVALTYFSIALIIFGIIALFLKIIGGVL